MNKIKYLSKIIIFLAAVYTLGCKKTSSSDSNVTSSVIIKYEVTWSSKLLQSGSNQITYVNSTGNGEIDANISGAVWTKTVTIQDVKNNPIVSVGTGLLLEQPGTGNVKIFVNGVLKSEVNGAAINTGNGYSLALLAHLTLQ